MQPKLVEAIVLTILLVSASLYSADFEFLDIVCMLLCNIGFSRFVIEKYFIGLQRKP